MTICIQDRKCLLGEVEGGEMVLNDAGRMVDKWYNAIPDKYDVIETDTYVIMPNHIHAIIINRGVGADPRVCPENIGEHRGSQIRNEGEHTGSPLHCVVQWFKTMTTNEYIRGVKREQWQEFRQRLWQRNYYEHIIRNEDDYYNTKAYIIANPKNWGQDQMYEQEVF